MFLSIKYTPIINKEIIRSTSGNNPKITSNVNTITIDSRSNIKRWQKDLNQLQIDLIKEQTIQFWPSFYKEEDWQL